ncbi:MAG: hypothetical protein ACK6A9_06260, partial [Dolichospermum sp.]
MAVLPPAAKVMVFHVAGVPATDIVLGIPLYGRTWTGVNAGSNNGLFQQGTGSSELTYRELYNLLGTNGYQSFW